MRFLLFLSIFLLSLLVPAFPCAAVPSYRADETRESYDRSQVELVGHASLEESGLWKIVAERMTLFMKRESAHAYGSPSFSFPSTGIFLTSRRVEVAWGKYPLFHALSNVRFSHGDYEFLAQEVNYEPGSRFIDLFGGVRVRIRGWDEGVYEAVRYDLLGKRILSRTFHEQRFHSSSS